MKLIDKQLKYKNIECYAFGLDFKNGNPYYYVQTVSNSYLDFEIISSQYRFISLAVGKILSLITQKRLINW